MFFLTESDRTILRGLIQRARSQPVNHGEVQKPEPTGSGQPPPILFGYPEAELAAAETDANGRLTKAGKGEGKPAKLKGDATGILRDGDKLALLNVLTKAIAPKTACLFLRDQTIHSGKDYVADKSYLAFPIVSTMPIAVLSEAHAVSQSGFVHGAEFFVPFGVSETNDAGTFGFEGAAGDETTVAVKAEGIYLVLWGLNLEPLNETFPSLTAADPTHPTASEITTWLNLAMQYAHCLVGVVVTDVQPDPDVDTVGPKTRASFMAFLGHSHTQPVVDVYTTAKIKKDSKIRLLLTAQTIDQMQGQVGGGFMIVVKIT